MHTLITRKYFTAALTEPRLIHLQARDDFALIGNVSGAQPENVGGAGCFRLLSAHPNRFARFRERIETRQAQDPRQGCPRHMSNHEMFPLLQSPAGKQKKPA
jgi:hypothetical protein